MLVFGNSKASSLIYEIPPVIIHIFFVSSNTNPDLVYK